jgi:hypothetical protein
MKVFVSTEDGTIHSSIGNYIRGFTEYRGGFEEIPVGPIDTQMGVAYTVDTLLLFPNTHIINLWHLMHHLFAAYKSLRGSESTNAFPVFFRNFHKRQGDITKCVYNDLIFRGLGLNYEAFLKIYSAFKENKCIEVNRLQVIDTDMNFHDKPLFQEFRSFVLKNMGVKCDGIKKGSITFILRRDNRKILNIEDVKKNINARFVFLEDYSIQEQFEIIVNTDVFIGLHGAGLTWAIMMKPGSLLIEIYPGKSNTDNYSKWCELANIRYKRVESQVVEGEEYHFRSCNVVLLPSQLNEIRREVFDGKQPVPQT